MATPFAGADACKTAINQFPGTTHELLTGVMIKIWICPFFFHILVFEMSFTRNSQSFLKGILLSLSLLICMGSAEVLGQTDQISGVVNRYARVLEIYERRENSPVNAVKVTEPDSFAVGDVIMLYQPKGYLVDKTTGEWEELDKFRPNTGAYSINKIDSILLPDSIIVFVAPTPFSKEKYAVGAAIQLIRVPYYKDVIISDVVRAQPWSKETGEGGVVALFVEGKLTLGADIDVSGQGFQGADPSLDNYEGGCYETNPSLYGQGFYQTTEDDLAGLKGEGPVNAGINDSLRGKYPLVTGGGGGNARFAGGGGGGNYNAGGSGGTQSSECATTPSETKGRGGLGMGSSIYYNDEGTIFTSNANRIFFGGGGGSGTQSLVPSIPASKGGTGGGIVVIIADTIVAEQKDATSRYAIKANGESVTDVAMAGAGGGGAGGCIVLDVNHYSTELSLYADGGDGGNTSNTFYTGPGGGGAGGVFWVRESDQLNYSISNSYGAGGRWLNDTDPAVYDFGGTGLLSEVITGLVAPLNGFLFNTLPGNRTVCTNITPDTLFASSPKGGSGVYVYRWDTRFPSEDSSWVIGDTVSEGYYVFEAPLTDTLQIRRIVIDTVNGISEGFDVSITYNILPEIEGNTIESPDEICYGLTAETLEQHPDSTLRGADTGPGAFDTTFTWISRPLSSGEWLDVPGSTSDAYTPSGDTVSKLYSRIAYSGVCIDTSNAVQITVLPEITNNSISVTGKDTICFGMQSDPISGTLPQDGDGPGSYTYAWQVSPDGTNWGSDPDSAVYTTNETFNLQVWDTSKFIRRIVYSGEDSTCVSTSNTQKITVLDTISNNVLIPDTDMITICQFNALPDGGITGTTPVGGNPGNYSYSWQVRDKTGAWADSASLAPDTKFNLQSFDDTTYIRRLVVSGEDGVCKSYTDSLVVGVVWKIENNVLSATPETYCQGDALATTLTAGALSGGANGIGIQWQYRTETGDWMPAPGDHALENYDFPEALGESLYFRRYTWSEPTDSVCFDTTTAVKITVQDSIQQNDILLINDVPLANDILDSICAGLDLELTGAVDELTGGDGNNYAFRWEVSSQPDFSGSDVAITPGYSIPDFRDSAFFRRIVVSGECEDTTARLLVQPIELPTGKLVLAPGQEDQVCSSNDIPVELSIDDLHLDPLAKSYEVAVSFASEDTSGSKPFERSVNQDPLVDFFVASDSAETYVYTLDQIIDDRGCVSEALDPNQPSILVFYSPEVTIMAADTLVCGPEVRLTATNQGGVPPPKWFASTVKNNLDGSDTVTFTTDGLLEADAALDFWFNDTVVMVYGFLLETSAEVGKACADSAYVTVTHFQEPRQDTLLLATDDFYVQQTYDLAQLEPEIDVGLDTWTVDNSGAGFGNPANTIASGFTFEQGHVYTWTVENGRYPDGSYVCPPNIDEVILVQHDLRQYDGFSPNNDGFNQLFVIPGLIHATDFTFTLYNSWGTRVYGISKAESEIREVEIDGEFMEEHIIWDGYLEDQGTVASPGTYYYTLTFEIEGSAIEYAPKQGFIILKR